jgi:hypothetical protein
MIAAGPELRQAFRPVGCWAMHQLGRRTWRAQQAEMLSRPGSAEAGLHGLLLLFLFNGL